MTWLKNLFYALTHKNVDTGTIKQKLQATEYIEQNDLLAYVHDIELRNKKMVKDLRAIYKKYNITFTGFKSFDLACDYLRTSIKNGKEAAHNNLIKLESMVTSEQQRHLALIRMAVSPDGRRIIDQINRDPVTKQAFDNIFGARDVTGKMKDDGAYQRLWSEIHKLSEYILLQKNKVYH